MSLINGDRCDPVICLREYLFGMGLLLFQLYMVRTMLESLITERNGGKKMLRKDVDPHHLLTIDDFHRRSFFWSYLLNFNGKHDAV